MRKIIEEGTAITSYKFCVESDSVFTFMVSKAILSRDQAQTGSASEENWDAKASNSLWDNVSEVQHQHHLRRQSTHTCRDWGLLGRTLSR